MISENISGKGRQTELDIARGLAVIFMVLIHVTEYYWNEENIVYGKIANFLGSPPAAPVFMFLLGCGIIYSRHNTAGELFRRGIKMLGLSYLFNALVYVLPYGIYCLAEHDAEYWSETWTQIYDADILQFASLSFLFFALIRKLELKIPGVIGVSVLCSVAGMILNSRISEIDTPVIQAVTGLFWGTHEGSYFPFLSWIPYVSAGYVFATFLRQTDDKKKFYLRISSMSGAVYLALTFIAVQFYDWDDLMDGEVYYHQNLFINLMFIAFVLMWLGVCFALANILNDKILTVLRNLSSRVTAVYVFQYLLIIYISVLVFGEETPLNAGLTLGLFAVYMIVSCLGAGCYQKIALNIRQKRYAVSAVNRVH